MTLAPLGTTWLVALALAAPAIAPPSRPGPWRQLGPAPASRPGKLLRFYRTAQNPTAIGIVASSSSARTITLRWSSYCEFESDDAQIQEDQGSVAGVGSVAAYPPVLTAATLCYVWVNARVAGNGRVRAAEFAY